MLTTSQFSRSAVVAATMIALAAAPAVARPIDKPLRPAPAVTAVAPHTGATPEAQMTQLRLRRMGVGPAVRSGAPAATGVPLTNATNASRGGGVAALMIVAFAVLALLVVVTLAGTLWRRAHPLRAGHA